ncbi:MAG: YihA family ribosome biogenesis GTP-binding protein [Clostridia bacterium]|nr:YihA family ribosome biogenesis GTP-binding protein [Clostridia bacterium]
MIKNAVFHTSVASVDKFLSGEVPEIAVAGKSNVGKSSFINALCGNKKLAKTSKDPGRTRLLNYFKINNGQFFLVDLPGYGYAKVSDDEKMKWGTLIESYFRTGKNIKNVFVLIDVRRDPSEDDKQMLHYLYFYRIPFTIIATKADKLSKSACFTRKKQIADAIGVGTNDVFLTSSVDKSGLNAIYDRIDSILENEE